MATASAPRVARPLAERPNMSAPHSRRTKFVARPGWPLVVIFAGMPLWWVLGLTQIIFFLMSVPMAVYLMRRRRVLVPRGLGVWLLFLVWLLGGLFVLQTDAPGAIPGESNARYLTFSYRVGWYILGTIALLYVTNTRSFLSTQRIGQALSLMCLTLVGGGLLGVLVPTLEFPSALELALPSSISNNGFVNSLIHPQTAQIQDFLGYVEPRPSAPFSYTNEWGLNLAVTLPFFVVTWWRRGKWYRASVPLVLVLAVLPVVSSLNRGLWLAFLVVAFFLAVRYALTGRLSLLTGLIIVVVLAAVSLAVSPLGDLIQDRINTPHSNQGRANLSSLSVRSALEGSPAIGFGTTRNVQGNFTSIAGGATDRCPGCSPPPLGTQGHLWLLLFGAGLGGLALYVTFFAGQFLRHLRDRSAYSVAGQCALLALFVTMPVYNAVSTVAFMALIAVAIMDREADSLPERTLSDLLGPARRNIVLVLLATLLGAAAGALIQQMAGSPTSATQSVLVPMNNPTDIRSSRPLSLDSEARLAVSTPVLAAVASAVGEVAPQEVADHLSITAEPNTRILNLTYTADDPEIAVAATREAARAFIDIREGMVSEAQTAQLQRLEARQAALQVSYALASSTADLAGAQANPKLQDTAGRLRAESAATFDQIAALQSDEVGAGQALHDMRVHQSNDPWLIRVASGLTMGAVLGLVLMWFADGRVSRLSRRPETQLGVGLPTVARIPPEAVADPSPEAILAAASAVKAYFPLCGILVAADSPSAHALGQRLNKVLVGAANPDGTRVLIIASTQSRPRRVRHLDRVSRRNGQEPVGLILIEE